ncbi:hypothetical protein CON36_31440 [Bacillus cereus]|uniref:Uncharacterized protein n=1 Tax=Bacillus cereus TaxID=1396 RepID=A0A9X6XW45_BACCE|nr:hypothetical protein [Bacillus cereus]PDZ94881.1 hypothetical protein CON36_31440 [Bacillus cereus]
MDNEESYSSGYDGGFVGDRRSKKSSTKSPKIPKFRSFIKVRKRHRARVQSDFETKILTWTIISFLISALFHTETVFVLFYGLFVLYTIISKDIRPIRILSGIILATGVVFFIALTFAVFVSLFSLLTEPFTWTAYKYIVGAPVISWVIVRVLDKWIYND